MNSPYRYTETRVSDPSLEWERLPELGGVKSSGKHAGRGAAWRMIIAGVGFWLVLLGGLAVSLL